MTTLAFVFKHPDGTDCPEYSYPVQHSCPQIGTGVHAGAVYIPDPTTSDEDILNEFIGPLDIEHLVKTGERRRIVRTRHAA